MSMRRSSEKHFINAQTARGHYQMQFKYILAKGRGGGGVKRFSDRQIWPQKAHGLWILAVNRADSRILNTHTEERGSAVNFGADSRLCLS